MNDTIKLDLIIQPSVKEMKCDNCTIPQKAMCEQFCQQLIRKLPQEKNLNI